jgi:hypothetical protein
MIHGNLLNMIGWMAVKDPVGKEHGKGREKSSQKNMTSTQFTNDCTN